MRRPDDLVVVDRDGAPLELDTAIDGGNGVSGAVVGFRETDHGVVVDVEWPDSPVAESFRTELRFMERIPVLLCRSVEVVG